jgi:phosphatidylinositol alpha-1,6-mannosyltransferase
LHGGLERARVCWLGTESDNPLSIKDGGLPTVLILSRIDLDLHKGHQELIDAWPRVVERVPVAKLLVAGAGPGYDAVRDAIARSPVAGSIKLTGYVPEEQLPQLWSRATVFAMPSRGEGFGLTYIEAMRHGVPVIASRQDAGQEVNVHGVTGYNVNLDTPEDLSEALISLLSDPEKACVMGAAGRERWRRHFTYSVFKSRFLGLLSEEGLLSVPWNEPI